MMRRCWGVRHLRWAWHTWQLYRQVRAWYYLGLGLGVPNDHDLRVLDDIWEGKA